MKEVVCTSLDSKTTLFTVGRSYRIARPVERKLSAASWEIIDDRGILRTINFVVTGRIVIGGMGEQKNYAHFALRKGGSNATDEPNAGSPNWTTE